MIAEQPKYWAAGFFCYLMIAFYNVKRPKQKVIVSKKSSPFVP